MFHVMPMFPNIEFSRFFFFRNHTCLDFKFHTLQVTMIQHLHTVIQAQNSMPEMAIFVPWLQYILLCWYCFDWIYWFSISPLQIYYRLPTLERRENALWQKRGRLKRQYVMVLAPFEFHRCYLNCVFWSVKFAFQCYGQLLHRKIKERSGQSNG